VKKKKSFKWWKIENGENFHGVGGASRRLYCPVTAVLFEYRFLLLFWDNCIVCQAKTANKERESKNSEDLLIAKNLGLLATKKNL
jgi:hypothetical protein